jgi:hypothetical protein
VQAASMGVIGNNRDTHETCRKVPKSVRPARFITASCGITRLINVL